MATRHFSLQRGPAPSHSSAQTARAQLGLTQQELAQLLGVSRTALAMAEQGSRDLPSAAAQRLLNLLQALAALPAPVPAAVLSTSQREDLEIRLQAIQLAEYPLRQQLRRVQIKLAQARLRQQAEPALRATLLATEALAHRKLSRLAEAADAYLRDEGATPALLELRLQVLAFERAEVARLLNGPALAG
ncbi:MAG: helix-turn-helix domain-containing protein [Cytophagaceae bacterium]|nr:MAG: helix-turn-helix domain-containing protein [Cytophagaceae bacterium]